MKAALFQEFRGPLRVTDVPSPSCPEDGAIVAVRTCGVCRSDWHAWTGADPDVSAPHVPGHEFAGEVVEVGARCSTRSVGDRVTAPFVLGCGQCADCDSGEATICDQQTTIGFTDWGAFAEQVAIPHADFNLVTVPKTIDFASAAGLGCRVTTAFRALVDRGRLQSGEWLAVHGCGGVGLSAVMLAQAIGAKTIAMDVVDSKLQLARSLGADATIRADQVDDVGQAVRDATRGGAHVSVDALGVTATFLNSLRSLRKLGRHVQIGMPVHEHADPPLPLLELIYSRQLAIYGTRGLPLQRFQALFEWIEQGRLDVSQLVTRRIGLDAAGAALREMDDYQTQGPGIAVIEI